MTDLDDFQNQRNNKRQRQVAHIYRAGPRPVFEAMLELAEGRPLDAVLNSFTKVSVQTYKDVGASELPVNRRLS